MNLTIENLILNYFFHEDQIKYFQIDFELNENLTSSLYQYQKLLGLPCKIPIRYLSKGLYEHLAHKTFSFL